MRINYAKIVATLGPSSDSFSIIEEMVLAGMDSARLNFSHGSYENFKQIVKNVRKASQKHKRPVAIIQDLQGPKIRIGKISPEGIQIKKGQKLVFSTASNPVKDDIPVQYKNLHKDVKKGHNLYLDDGSIKTKITKITGERIFVTAMNKGTIYSNKGINAPQSSISAKTLTAKDLKDLDFGLSVGVDFVALSFVKSAKDIHELRSILMRKKSSHVKIIAKIERNEAIENLEEIIDEADGVMVARGDLGIEIQPEQVPVVQKTIIKLSNQKAKPVITATQVLSSMIENPTPTRAEISDAANAVYDQTDAIMLSNESATGAYPVQSVRTLAKVISAVENELKKHRKILKNEIKGKNSPDSNPTCLSACELATSSRANKIIAYSSDGYTIRQIVKHRVLIPTIVITENKNMLNSLGLLWGINKILYKKFTRKQVKTGFAREILNFLIKEKIVKKDEKVVVVFNSQDKGSISLVTA